MTEYYCVYYGEYDEPNKPYAIYGIGTSKYGAIKDARENIESDKSISDYFVSKCSKAVYDDTKARGGDGYKRGGYKYEKGKVCLASEEMRGYNVRPHKAFEELARKELPF